MILGNDAFKFSGEGAANYDFYLGPFLFEPYAKEMASRVPITGKPESVLEIACGTGRVTNHLRKRLPATIRLVASDLTADMLAIARNKYADIGAVEFVEADIQNLSFPDNSFDHVVCQFGMMFLPDKQKGFSEVYRVLKPGGSFTFSTWERTENIDIFRLILNETIFPFFKGEDTTKFIVPFSMYDENVLKNYLLKAGFNEAKVERIVLPGEAPNPMHIVNGLLLKHSLGKEVYDRDPAALEPMAKKLEQAIIKRFSTGPIRCELAAFVSTGIKMD